MPHQTDSILETDLVLVYIENQPAFYGRVEQITADVKPGWWRIKFLFLTFPPQLTTWIIDDEQIRGADFTMGGTPIRIEKVRVPQETPEQLGEEKEEEEGGKKQARVLSMFDKGQEH